jgi:hypothetical protein
MIKVLLELVDGAPGIHAGGNLISRQPGQAALDEALKQQAVGFSGCLDDHGLVPPF